MTNSSSKTPLIVGIAGGSASGKTTFTQALTQTLSEAAPALRSEVFSMDRYFRRDQADGPTFISPATGQASFNANHPDSADNQRLLGDMELRRSESDPPDVIIIEGLMALHVPEIRERLDLRLFIELDADERALRRLLRDMKGSRGTKEPEAIATYYRECARIGHARYVEPSRLYADLILRGDADFQRTAVFIAAIIRERHALLVR